MMKKKELFEALKSTKKNIFIVSHRSPDGDSIGSSLGLYHYLNDLGHEVTVATPDQAPAFLAWMAGFEEILNFEKQKEQATEKMEAAELIFCLDFNALSRTGNMEQTLRKQDAIFVNIDHHRDPDDFADYQISDTSASSTAQLVYQFVQEIEAGNYKSADFAKSIYTGILTDTGSFRFSSTSSETHRIAADLLDMGAEPTFIHSQVFDSYSADRLKLLGFALHDKLEILKEYKTAIIALTEKELQTFNFQKGDTEGLVNFPLSVKEVKMAILITQKDGKVKMSFRSKGEFPVNKLAGEHFNGGGHLNAAGGISKLDVPQTVEKIKKLLPDYEEGLNA